jgi:hypothetical protein
MLIGSVLESTLPFPWVQASTLLYFFSFCAAPQGRHTACAISLFACFEYLERNVNVSNQSHAREGNMVTGPKPRDLTTPTLISSKMH